MALTRPQFENQIERQGRAVRDLKVGGSFLQAIARAYYMVYVTASYAASHNRVVVKHFRDGKTVEETEDFTHNSIPDVVEALYSGQKRGYVHPGATPGVGTGHYSPRDAYQKTDLLQKDRKAADYGPTNSAEPYTPTEANERILWAQNLVADLRKII